MKALPHGPEVMCMPEAGLCENCLRAWLNRPAPQRAPGRRPATLRSHVNPWFRQGSDALKSYTGSVFWFALAYPDLPIIKGDPQMEAGHA